MPDPAITPPVTPATPPPEPPKQKETLLDAVPPASPSLASGAAKPDVPEKFRQADGTLNQEAILKSYTELEKRFGAGEAPPKTPDDYKLDYKLPDGVTLNKDAEKSFLASAHAQGMTNKQVQFVMDRYTEILGGQVKEQFDTKEKAVTVLKEAWGDSFDANMGLAIKAYNRFAADRKFTAEENAEVSREIGNNPYVLGLLSFFGQGLKEDTPPAGSQPSGVSEEEIQALMKSPAYWNSKDPEHEAVKAKVKAYHDRKFARKAG